MRDPHKSTYFKNDAQQPEVFMKSLTRQQLGTIILISVQAAAPRTVTLQIHHDSACPADEIGEISLRNGYRAKTQLLDTVDRCLCERLDLSMRTDMRDSKVKASRRVKGARLK